MRRPYWRRWWITYDVGVRQVRRARAGPYLTRHTAEHARRSIWRTNPEPARLLIVQEFRPAWWRWWRR